MLSEEAIEVLRARTKFGKIGVVDWKGHRLIFGQPDRAQIANFRRQCDSPTEKSNAMDQLCQVTLLAFDDETDKLRAVQAFSSFLDAFPAFSSSDKAQGVMNILTGAVEEEAEARLGKGAEIRSGTPPISQPA